MFPHIDAKNRVLFVMAFLSGRVEPLMHAF